jgi:hypothetical protein
MFALAIYDLELDTLFLARPFWDKTFISSTRRWETCCFRNDKKSLFKPLPNLQI